MTQIPKTVFATSITHGIIPITNSAITTDPEFIYKTLPKHMNLIRINVTELGVSNISTLENTVNINDAICKKIHANIANQTTNLLRTAVSIKNVIKRTNRENKQGIIQASGDAIYEEKQSLFADYLHSADNMYKIEQIRGGDSYIEKIFTKFTEEELEIARKNDINENGFETDASDCFNRINIVNMEGMDVFAMFENMGYLLVELQFSDFIEFMNGLGVENVVLIDMSCNNIDTKDPRTMRRLRRNQKL